MTLKRNIMIRLGNTYQMKYLDGVQFKYEELKPKSGFVKSYLITNRPDAPIYRGVLEVLKDGRAVIHVKYTSYSGVNNKYENYFDVDGKEIIDENNSTAKELSYWSSQIVK